MPKGPQGQKRPGGVVGAAIMAAKIATGEIDEGEPQEVKRRAGIAQTLWSIEDIAALCDVKAPAKRGPYKKGSAA